LYFKYILQAHSFQLIESRATSTADAKPNKVTPVLIIETDNTAKAAIQIVRAL
jgi:hypothetical protein